MNRLYVCTSKFSFHILIFISFLRTKFAFSGLQMLNKQFLRANAFGSVRADMVMEALEQTLPGVSSYLLSKCSGADADPISAEFPVEILFRLLDEARSLDFLHCQTLLDLSIEVQRQSMERKQLFETFADPHPSTIFGRRKDSWFSQICFRRLDTDRYQCTYVSSVRFIEVSIIFGNNFI